MVASADVFPPLIHNVPCLPASNLSVSQIHNVFLVYGAGSPTLGPSFDCEWCWVLGPRTLLLVNGAGNWTLCSLMACCKGLLVVGCKASCLLAGCSCQHTLPSSRAAKLTQTCAHTIARTGGSSLRVSSTGCAYTSPRARRRCGLDSSRAGRLASGRSAARC